MDAKTLLHVPRNDRTVRAASVATGPFAPLISGWRPRGSGRRSVDLLLQKVQHRNLTGQKALALHEQLTGLSSGFSTTG